MFELSTCFSNSAAGTCSLPQPLFIRAVLALLLENNILGTAMWVRNRRAIQIAAAALLLAVEPASAIEYHPLELEGGGTAIVVAGEFTHRDNVSDLINLISTHNAKVVTFDSPGGNPFSAMLHGRAIRAYGLASVQFRALECSSACAFAFLGGVKRYAMPGSIGVHRSYLTQDAVLDRDGAVVAIQQLTAEVLRYLREMDVDPEFLQMSLEYGSDDMRYLSRSEMTRMRVTTDDLEEDNAIAAAPSARTVEPAVQPRLQTSTDMRPAAIAFVRKIIVGHTMPQNAALAIVSQGYANTVNYFGEIRSLPTVIDDKRRYFDRWPERSYNVRQDTIEVSCTTSTCLVQGIYDWSVRSVPRNRQASGTASFEFEVDTRALDMRIVRETSTVLSR